ncbi:hypothetical protein [Cognatishimia activa]|uniref:hypothetical protein n=1 Tax=Cognatishimia activa TaxID=1715691 RepID=UPI002230163F|nr:hypothetical protein [Cognatishimia activa]UZD91282.1 hypothetical protein M0D42_01315 [Cognatishimia activa]
MTKQPNVVDIMADQLAPRFCGTYGHPIAKTPHIDALAARGMRIDTAHDNAFEFRATVPTFAQYLMLLALGEADQGDQAIGDYCAEMTPWPVFMIRRRAFKYIHCDVNPPQLSDVARDPMATRNLAQDPDHAATAEALSVEIMERWDSAHLRTDINATQKSPRALHAAMDTGAGMHWDDNPTSDASQQDVRNHMDWTVAAGRYRFSH